MRLEDKIKQAITIPVYHKRYINDKIDLDEITGSIPCDIHHEKHGASFSYNKELKVWSCWGKCHKTGDVIDLHQKWYNLPNRDEATKSLALILNITEDRMELVRHKAKVNILRTDMIKYLNRAEALVNNIDACIELDYLMSQLKTDSETIDDLKDFIKRHGGRVE